MEKLYNKSLADLARIQILTDEYNGHSKTTEIQREFDSSGNVIRNYKKELEILSKDEQNHILPSLDNSYFDSFRKHKEHIITSRSSTPSVFKVKLAPLPPSQSDDILKIKTFFFMNLRKAFAGFFF